jgi:transcriptional regulator with XRE-family HTH domain
MNKPYLCKVDPFVGARIRSYRKKLGWSLGEMAQKLSLSCQQLQKYEQGKTRISVGTLYKVSLVTGIQSQYFFEGFDALHKRFVKKLKNEMPEGRKKPLDILLLEHNPEDAIVTRKAIENSDIKSNFHIFHNGLKILEFLKEEDAFSKFPKPEIIFLELSPQKKESLSTLKEIKRVPFLCDIPVIVVTNCGEREEIIKCYRYNAAGFIRKTPDFKEYCEHINLTLQYWSNAVKLPRMDEIESGPKEKEAGDSKEEQSPKN